MDAPTTAPQLPATADITVWLEALDQGLEQGDSSTVNRLFAALYGELKRNAASHMRKEYDGHTLSATALTHEAWERLAEQTRTQWASRSHFLAMASIMMRRILVNHARGQAGAQARYAPGVARP